MEKYLIDTNVVSDYFSNSFSNYANDFVAEIIDNIPNLSIITQLELLCWKASFEIEENIKSFISDSNIFLINSEIVKISVKIRRDTKTKLPDTIIAATAIASNMVLVTNNEKDFKTISNLKIINPHNL